MYNFNAPYFCVKIENLNGLVRMSGIKSYKDLFSIPTFGSKAANRSKTNDPLISLLQKNKKPSSKLLRTRLCSIVSQGQRKVII